jgi:hypothetical protein
LSESIKRIYMNENQLSLLNEYFNHEYDNVEYIKLYHGTSLEEVNNILEEYKRIDKEDSKEENIKKEN